MKLLAACKTGKTREASRLLSDGANIEYEDFLSRATRALNPTPFLRFSFLLLFGAKRLVVLCVRREVFVTRSAPLWS